MKKIIVSLLIALSLQGCVAVFVAGAAAGGLMVYDRRSIKTFTQDNQIQSEVFNRVNQIPAVKNQCHVVVAAFNHAVLITGQVPNPELNSQILEIARTTPMVRHVYNELEAIAPTSSITRTSDSWITTKVRSMMLSRKGLSSSQIKVVTENGVVYLMGIVTANQANLAVDTARRVAGVQKVVKLFEYNNG
ncbi:MAG: BON domain-containing protein [Legionellales bacterium]|nr:BON domain-containing protein [Legionellales bacterium]